MTAPPMGSSLRTLLILTTLGPPALTGAWYGLRLIRNPEGTKFVRLCERQILLKPDGTVDLDWAIDLAKHGLLNP